MRLEYVSSLYRDRQIEAPLAYCAECLGEIYGGDIAASDGERLYHAKCYEQKTSFKGGLKYGDMGNMPQGKG